MKNERPWRMPLQTGEAALRALAIGAVLWLPTAVAVSFVFALLVGSGIPGSGYVIGVVALLGVFVFKQLRRAWRLRPSDVFFDEEGFVIDGGPFHGRRWRFSSVGGTDLQPGMNSSNWIDRATASDDEELHRLSVRAGAGLLESVAWSDTDTEIASLTDLRATIDAAREPPPTLEAPPQVLRCAHCEGPVAPSAEALTRCPWCERETAVPEALREKVIANEALSTPTRAVVAEVLGQTPAPLINLVYVVVATLMLASWPVAVALVAFRSSTVPDGRAAQWVVLFLVATVLGASTLFRLFIVDRQALAFVTLRLGALGAAAPGKPRRCRQCLGSLPDGGVLVTCAFCDSPNVIGLERAVVAQANQQQRSLVEVLARRTKERRVWRVLGVVGAGLLIASGWSLWELVGR